MPLPVAPLLPGPGIQKHTGDRQLDGTAGSCRRIEARQALGELGHPIHPAGLEVPPAAVPGNVEARIGGAGDIHHVGCGSIELRRMIGKVL